MSRADPIFCVMEISPTILYQGRDSCRWGSNKPFYNAIRNSLISLTATNNAGAGSSGGNWSGGSDFRSSERCLMPLWICGTRCARGADRQTVSAANGSEAPGDYQTHAEENSEAQIPGAGPCRICNPYSSRAEGHTGYWSGESLRCWGQVLERTGQA